MKLLLKNKKININKNINLEDYKTNIEDGKSLVNIECFKALLEEKTSINNDIPLPVDLGGLKKRMILGSITVKKVLDNIFYS